MLLPVFAGVHVALLELRCGFGVFRVAFTVVLWQSLVGSDVVAFGRVQLVTCRTSRNVTNVSGVSRSFSFV